MKNNAALMESKHDDKPNQFVCVITDSSLKDTLLIVKHINCILKKSGYRCDYDKSLNYASTLFMLANYVYVCGIKPIEPVFNLPVDPVIANISAGVFGKSFYETHDESKSWIFAFIQSFSTIINTVEETEMNTFQCIVYAKKCADFAHSRWIETKKTKLSVHCSSFSVLAAHMDIIPEEPVNEKIVIKFYEYCLDLFEKSLELFEETLSLPLNNTMQLLRKPYAVFYYTFNMYKRKYNTPKDFYEACETLYAQKTAFEKFFTLAIILQNDGLLQKQSSCIDFLTRLTNDHKRFSDNFGLMSFDIQSLLEYINNKAVQLLKQAK